MFVVKRNGDSEPMDFEKIHRRINYLVKEPFNLEHVNGTELTQRVIQGLINNIRTRDIDIYAAGLAASLGITHLEYLTLAGRIAINNHHKNTLNSFKDKIYMLYRKKNTVGENCPIISTPFYKYVYKNQNAIDKYIDYSRDYILDFFGFKTLEKGYLLSINGEIIERPQDLFMRVAIQIHMPKELSLYKDVSYLKKIFEAYDMISQQYYTHATPTLFNSGAPSNNLSSCFLLGTEDSLEGIMKTLTDSVTISKWSGGVGIHISNWRSEGSLIKGTNGKSSGIIPFLRMFNDGARAFNQGGKRNGSFSIYLEMHHPDLMKFLDIKKPHGDENLRCRDLFPALWISDLFMKRLEAGTPWSVFDPDECPGLNEVYGDEYEKLYLKYESEGRAKKTYNIDDIIDAIQESQMEKGVPYIQFKDTINKYSMQKNIGIIKSSNLCVTGDTEILTDKGYFPIKYLAETKNSENKAVHKVWNSEIFSEAVFAKTGENREILEIELTHGNIIKCTPQHKFIIAIGPERAHEKEIDASELKIGDAVIQTKFPVVDNDRRFGFNLRYIKENPTSIYAKLDWLANLIDSNGSLEKNETLQINSCDREFLLNVKLLSNTLGVDPIMSISSINLELNKKIYTLLFNSYDTFILYKMGLNTKSAQYTGQKPDIVSRSFNKIKSIKKLETLEDTYCFNEPLKHRGVFNGVLLGNCTEITLFSNSNEYACCNLSSICLSKFVEDSYSEEELAQETKRVLNHEFPIHPKFNYQKLAQVAEQLAENLNNVIDKTWNPVIETVRSNFQHRPIGIGIQGLNDVFMKFRVPFESENAKKLNKKIAEVIYFGALTGSTRASKKYYQNIINSFDKESGEAKEVKVQLYTKELIKQFPALKKENVITVFKSASEVPKDIGAYSSYHRITNNEEAPIKTKFHWELYGLTKDDLSGLCDWETLRSHIDIYGVRNSTVVAYMPTASTSQIMGNSACFEPYLSNLFKRKTLAGHYTVINKYLMNDLIKLGLWNDKIKQYLLMNEGSIQDIEGIPEHMKNLYKTIWNIKQKTIIDLAADRQPFIDQSQSMNLYLENYDSETCASIMMYGWKSGLKSGSYYIYVTPAAEAQNFTVDVGSNTIRLDADSFPSIDDASLYEEVEDEEICLLCSS